VSPVLESRRPIPPLPPRSWLGVLGGGQLGRMFCMAAQSLGYRVCVLDPAADSPAGSVAERHLQAEYLDEEALAELADLCGAVTTEFENVPARALEFLAGRCTVSPAAGAVAIAQDRIAEKAFIRRCGIATAPYAPVLCIEDLGDVDAGLLPGILKTARLGYDGKGQAQVATVEQARAAFESFGGVPCVLEKRIELEREVSVIVARGFDADCVVWPVAENVHVAGILSTSTVPAHIPEALSVSAKAAARSIAQALDYAGVLCVEFFVASDGSLLANEMAPRPHNSGHYSIDACVTSQFEQQARVLAGLPLGATRQHSSAVMLNLLGDCWQTFGGEPPWAGVLAYPGTKLHLYGKAEPRPGRKMGHVTVVADSCAQATLIAAQIAQTLGIPRWAARRLRIWLGVPT
jgi:5-(carboxyamino)imidazole ribonucleotide synthase